MTARLNDPQGEAASTLLTEALQLLGRKNLSEGELRARLRVQFHGGSGTAGADNVQKKAWSGGEPEDFSAALDAVIERLQDWGYLNDRRLCDALVAKMSGNAAHGPAWIRQKLRSRMIPDELVQIALSGADAGDGQTETALSLVRRKFGQGGTVDRARMARFLSGRGFSAGTVGKVLARFGEECHDNQQFEDE